MFSLQLPKHGERGFTLIELLVVIIIIGILAAVAIPLFLDQRKLAVDASVKSDVRNTATQVQTWLAQNPGSVATDATDYKSKGGNVSSSTGNTVNLSVATDGSYLVCGYAGTVAKQYTASSAAYVYDSTSGKFGLGSCSGGIVGGGSPSSSATTSAPAGNSLGGGVSNGTYTATLETGDPTNSMWSTPQGQAGTISTAKANTGTSSYAQTYTGSQGNSNNMTGAPTTNTNGAYVRFTPSPALSASTGTYTVTAYVYLATSNVNERVTMGVTGANASGPDANQIYTSFNATNQWVKMTRTLTPAQAAGNSIFFNPFSSSNASPGGTMYIDDLTITYAP